MNCFQFYKSVFIVLFLGHFNLLAQIDERGSLRLLESVNTEMDDFFPCFSPSGEEIYFSRKNKSRGPNSDFNILMTKEVSKKNWTSPVTIESLSNNSASGIGHISSDGERFYVQGNFKDPKSTNFENGIFVFLKSGNSWKIAERLRIPYFKNHSQDQSFCLNHDEDVLIISMEHFSTKGVEDLYYSKRLSNGNWTELKSLGKSINTEYEEFSPWLDYDNRTLFFSSNGFKTLGSKDIFVSIRTDETWQNWTPPINLGPLVNSEGMELAFRRSPKDPEHFLLVSAQSSDGHSDLYQYFIPDSLLPLPSRLFEIGPDSLKKSLANQSILLLSDKNKIRVVAKNRNRNKAIAFKGEILNSENVFLDSGFAIARDTLEFEIFEDTVFLKVASSEHLSFEKRVIFSNQSVGVSNLEIVYLDSLISGKPIQLENVHFHKGTPSLLTSSYLQLDRVLEFLQTHENKKIQLIGHTDIAGNQDLNQKLSEERAKAVKSYLVEKGIRSNRIKTEGLGGSQPLTEKRDEESRKRNRRVEFIIL